MQFLVYAWRRRIGSRARWLFLIIFLIAVTSHEAWDFCFWCSLPFRIDEICLPLPRAWRWMSVTFFFDVSLGVVPLSLVCMSVGEVSLMFGYCVRQWQRFFVLSGILSLTRHWNFWFCVSCFVCMCHIFLCVGRVGFWGFYSLYATCLELVILYRCITMRIVT